MQITSYFIDISQTMISAPNSATSFIKFFADSLNTKLYDDSKLRNETGQMTLQSRKLIREFKEEAPSWFIRLMGEPEIYLKLIGSTVLDIASRLE